MTIQNQIKNFFKKNTKIIFILILSVFVLSCEENKLTNNEKLNIHKVLKECVEIKSNRDFGIMLFGDSMLDLQSSFIMSYLSSKTNTFDGLGNCNYPIENNIVNNKGCFLNIEGDAELYDVNQQNAVLGQPEWPGRIGYLNGPKQKIKFVTFGTFPTKVITKIFILTDVVESKYDIERTTDNGENWLTIINNASTLDTVKGMKVHVFDDTSENTSVGYRVVWRSGQVMCLDPLFLKAGGNNIYHLTVGSGGADFKLQTSIPKQRIKFLIDEANIKMITSLHRFEVSNLDEFNDYLSLMDEWWKDKALDVLYYGQPPQANDDTLTDSFKKDINNAIKNKCTNKNYLYFDMYLAMGGIKNVKNKGWGESDPVHLSYDAYSSIAPNLLDFLGLKN